MHTVSHKQTLLAGGEVTSRYIECTTYKKSFCINMCASTDVHMHVCMNRKHTHRAEK